MITKTTVKALVAGGGVLATWFAVSPNRNAQLPVAQPAQHSAAAHAMTAEQLNAQAARLREHIREGQLRPATRNPFRFGVSKRLASRAPSVSAPVPIAPAESVAPPSTTYFLSGIAERNTSQGRKRTAVITGLGQLYLVGEGEPVGGRFLVVRIDSEAVLLRDQTGVELVLALRP